MTSFLYIVLLLASHHGLVMFGGVPVPGATVTATQGKKQFVTITDPQGAYSFADLSEGPFTIQVEMMGFTSVKQEVSGDTAEFELKMLPIQEMHAEVVQTAPSEPASAPVRESPKSRQAARQQRIPFQRTEIKATDTNPLSAPGDTPSPSGAFANLSAEDLNQRAADGLLINGSVNNAAASPFAQFARIGNAFRGRPLYNGNASLLLDNSALNARSYSLTGQETPEPSYNRLTASFNFGGPLRLPFLIKNTNNAPTFFVGYQRTQNRKADTATGRMPTAAERKGDFSQTLDLFGRPIQILDPMTRLPFAGNRIPEDRISPQAGALLNLFPIPNFNDTARYNYQIPIIAITHQDGVQARLNKSISMKNQVTGNFDAQSARSDNSNLFNFLDTSRMSGVSASVQWLTRPTQRSASVFRYQFNRQATKASPYFANRVNISGNAGISGNNQEAPYWGPPNLNFAGGTSSLFGGQYSFNRTQNHTLSYSGYWMRGRHNMTFGASLRRYQANILSQQDARGTFTFTGAAAGSDFAGFLLGIPDTSSIAFGNADKYFRQTFYDGFFADDFRITGALTINAGMRWEYETPIGEKQGRLVNLGIAPDYNSVAQLVGNNLIHPDRFGIQPRVSFAWRPFSASSLIVRGGYGIYRNTNVYQAIATQMAQQSPFSKTLSVQNTAANPLSLANGFVNLPGTTPNTFAVDPHFRVGYLQSWQLSVQRDMPATLQMTVVYLGTKGTRLPQESLPNTFPSGAANPSGYVYLSSNGNSIRHAGQIQLRRRLRNGLTGSAQYTFSRAFDDAPLMSGGIVTASQGGTAIAQNWLNLRAERAPSSFDQRHQLNIQMQYTTGVGVGGGALLSGWKGALSKGWTWASQFTVGSGLPLTPVYFTAVKGTGVTGNLRPDVTGASIKDAPPGLSLNPAAFRAPVEGQWGNAGRNSITGPPQFSLNSSLGRSFIIHDRYTVDFRVDATNVLNHVTVRSWNAVVTSAQFGLANRVDPMRSLQTTLRLRF